VLPGGHPDGFANEEYFGLLDIHRRPRAAYAALRDGYRADFVPPPLTMELRASSAGYAVPEYPQGVAEFARDGAVFYRRTGGAGGGRGFNVAAIDPGTGALLRPVAHFDTYITRGSGAELDAMLAFLAALPNGAVVMAAVADEAGLNLDDSCTRFALPQVEGALQALETLGSTRIRDLCFRDAWALIAVKGEGRALGEQLVKGAAATARTTITLP
jgi:hypothetical protein